MDTMMRRVPVLFYTTLLAVASLPFAASVAAQIPTIPPDSDRPAPAQPTYPACQPPNPGEYLLLVVSKTPESQDQVKRTLPPSATSTICNYVDEVVTRVSGFTSVDTANAWAKYLSETTGLSAFVARPSAGAANQEASAPPPQVAVPPISAPQTTVPPASVPQSTKPSALPSKPSQTAATSPRNPLAYNPKPLGEGYAVLVNYFNRPDLATQIQQLLGKEIGLVSYGQRPYLLAVHTSDPSQAQTTLQKLTDRGFWAVVVDSRQVILLRQTINVKQ
ncbi:hypothetical protein K9N68_16325 [Kovacikia minuta CCNUW1]|uniref:hypothetical protein n=1 Tax=Kovacikia minuta TaxID=2931930 RepID=UPI001CC9E3E2|nr:hypothetical protein [Kovacikia minuta]UBF29256.1 hypothetical protein K9N68_16325 [Kovacikia minuta CCNUW1]